MQPHLSFCKIAMAHMAHGTDIQTFVALIGEQGRNFVKEYYSCLVEDPATDVIVIDPASPSAGISALLARVCKADGYDVRITEVNPTEDGTYQPFIEIFNFGADVSLKACWDSATDASCSSATTVNTGEYFVARCNSGTGCSGTTPTAADVADLKAASAVCRNPMLVSAILRRLTRL